MELIVFQMPHDFQYLWVDSVLVMLRRRPFLRGGSGKKCIITTPQKQKPGEPVSLSDGFCGRSQVISSAR